MGAKPPPDQTDTSHTRLDFLKNHNVTIWWKFSCGLIPNLLIPTHYRIQDPTSVNGFSCKPVSDVTSEDFFVDGLSKEGNTTNAFGVSVAQGNVFAFPGLNTLGISMNRVDSAPGVVVIEGKVLVGLVTTGNVFYSEVLDLRAGVSCL
ncbi:germin-like protein 3-7 [Coffea arabica]|uniref:Germin-like protein 3-7 n=1 Tax=Coffea arabica TaxID=13443 RepID=A0A6P6X8V3_COFAR|nr:germin-like protein 3-7 [Coffea arabica]